MKLYILIDRIWKRLKSLFCVLDLKLMGANLPWGTKCEGRISVIQANHLFIGKGVRLGRHINFNILNKGKIVIGNNTKIAGFTRISALGGEVSIGNGVLVNRLSIITSWTLVGIGDNSMISAFCHITDRNHGLDKDISVRAQKGKSSPILIGSDVWIASSCIILKAVKIGDGAVIGANSLVNTSIDSYAIVAGSPARSIGTRN